MSDFEADIKCMLGLIVSLYGVGLLTDGKAYWLYDKYRNKRIGKV